MNKQADKAGERASSHITNTMWNTIIYCIYKHHIIHVIFLVESNEMMKWIFFHPIFFFLFSVSVKEGEEKKSHELTDYGFNSFFFALLLYIRYKLYTCDWTWMNEWVSEWAHPNEEAGGCSIFWQKDWVFWNYLWLFTNVLCANTYTHIQKHIRSTHSKILSS